MAHAKYSNEKLESNERVLDTPEYQLALYEARRCTGDGRASSGEGPTLSTLSERSLSGDWAWQPARDRAMGYGPESTFVTYRPAPHPLAGVRIFPMPPSSVEADADRDAFQARARAAHKAAGDYSHRPNTYA
jgi:hypothetical protein